MPMFSSSCPLHPLPIYPFRIAFTECAGCAFCTAGVCPNICPPLLWLVLFFMRAKQKDEDKFYSSFHLQILAEISNVYLRFLFVGLNKVALLLQHFEMGIYTITCVW
jgi:hypothetical protein